MNLNYLAFVLPVFLIFCGLEYYFSRKKNRQVFHFNETISNLNVGIFERTCDLFTTGLFYFFFSWLYERYAIFHFDSNLFSWIVLFLLTDFLWYWYHRWGHKVNILWSVHVVHHQSDDFNFTVSARITVFQAFFRSVFWSFIPVIGFPPEMITIMLLVHGAYPFFTHTQLVGKLGILEKILVTPSHHRLHHSSNEKYLDKNFGDMLIIWDKLFGTFTEEDEQEQAIYGITMPLNSYSFLWQHFHFLMETVTACKRANSWTGKWRAFFGKPEYIDPMIRKELEQKLLCRRPDQPLSKVLIHYISFNTIFLFAFVFLFLLFGHYQTPLQLVAGGLFAGVSVIHTSAVLEQRRWVFHIAFTRMLLMFCYLCLIFPHTPIIIPVGLLVLLLTLFYNTAGRTYLKLLTISIK